MECHSGGVLECLEERPPGVIEVVINSCSDEVILRALFCSHTNGIRPCLPVNRRPVDGEISREERVEGRFIRNLNTHKADDNEIETTLDEERGMGKARGWR